MKGIPMLIDQILETEYSLPFDQKRKEQMPTSGYPEVEDRFNKIRQNMMVMSYHKYGPMKENYSEYKCMDALGNIEKRIRKYKDTGNTEFLADVANFAMIEFMYPSIENPKSVSLHHHPLPPLEKNLFTLDTILSLIDQYKADGNTDHLVCIANLAFQEFAFPSLEGASYTPTDNSECELAGFSVNEIKQFC